MGRLVLICLAVGLSISMASQGPRAASAAGWSALNISGLSSLDSLLLEVHKKNGGGFFDEAFGDGRALCINDPSKKDKESLYKKCSKKSGTAKCFESIQQCCCYYKPN